MTEIINVTPTSYIKYLAVTGLLGISGSL